jgi:hypothetical protein
MAGFTKSPRQPLLCSLHIRVGGFAAFGDETVDPRGDNGQVHRAELEQRCARPRDANSGSNDRKVMHHNRLMMPATIKVKIARFRRSFFV